MKTNYLKKIGVVIHSHFLRPEEWKDVMWGDPRNGIFGIIPKGLQLAYTEQAEIVYLCNSIPKKHDERIYSPDVMEFIRLHANELPLEYAGIFNRIITDETAQNTNEEVKWVAEYAGMSSMPALTHLYLVTAPKHVFRAHQEFLQVKMAGAFKGITILAVASDVDFPNTDAAKVAIVESMHRCGLPKWNTWRYCQAIVGLMKDLPPGDFQRFLNALGILLRFYKAPADWPTHEPASEKIKV